MIFKNLKIIQRFERKYNMNNYYKCISSSDFYPKNRYTLVINIYIYIYKTIIKKIKIKITRNSPLNACRIASRRSDNSYHCRESHNARPPRQRFSFSMKERPRNRSIWISRYFATLGRRKSAPPFPCIDTWPRSRSRTWTRIFSARRSGLPRTRSCGATNWRRGRCPRCFCVSPPRTCRS